MKFKKIVENTHHSFPATEMTSLNALFCPTVQIPKILLFINNYKHTITAM